MQVINPEGSETYSKNVYLMAPAANQPSGAMHEKYVNVLSEDEMVVAEGIKLFGGGIPEFSGLIAKAPR